MRVLFSAGVMDVMMENGITFDGIIGVSAGAAFGCNYKSHQAGRALRYNVRFAHDWRFCSMRSWLTTGDLCGAEFAYRVLPKHLDIFDEEAFEADGTSFYVVATDIETGNPVYKMLDKCDFDFYEWIRASASMPLVSHVVEVEGRKMLDGGITDSVPLKYFESIGYERNIVVLTQHEGYKKKESRMGRLLRLTMRRYPRLAEAMDRRHIMYNSQREYIAESERKGNCLVIRPDQPLPIGRISHDPEMMKTVYDMGRRKAESMLDEIREFCNRNA